LEQAFLELLEEKGFQSVTVQDITDRATVNRATFYAHFEDKYALFDHIVRETFQQTL
jgi:AcrR family transcriptional regulator